MKKLRAITIHLVLLGVSARRCDWSKWLAAAGGPSDTN
jgi:hypothetical protein